VIEAIRRHEDVETTQRSCIDKTVPSLVTEAMMRLEQTVPCADVQQFSVN